MNSDRCQVPRPAPLVLHLLRHFGQQGFDLYFRRTCHQGLDRRSLPQLLIGYGLVGLGFLLDFGWSQYCIPLPQITSQYKLFTKKNLDIGRGFFLLRLFATNGVQRGFDQDENPMQRQS